MGKKGGRPKKGVMPPQLKAYWEGKRNKSTGGSTMAKRKRSTTRKTTAPRKRRGVGSITGNLGLMGTIGGGASLLASKYVVRKYMPSLGNYISPVAAIGAGLVGKFLKIPGTGMLTAYGIIDGVSEFGADAISPGGIYTIPGIGGATQATRGYEY